VPGGLDRRLMLPIFLVVGLDATSTAAVLTVLPFHLDDLGATPLVIGVVLGAEGLSQLVAAPLIGRLSDRFGRKKVLLVSQAGAVLSLALLAVASSMVFVLLARVLLGLTAESFPAAAAYVADHSTAADRRQGIGVLSAGLGFGGLVGPTLAGAVSDLSLIAAIVVALAMSATSLVVTTLAIEGGPPPGRGTVRGVPGAGEESETVPMALSFRALLDSAAIRVLVVVMLCHFFAYQAFNSQLGVFLPETFRWDGHAFGPTELGYLLTADGAINIVVQLFLLKWLSRRFTERNLIVLAFGVLAVGYLLAGTATGIWLLAVAAVCVSTGAAVARSTFVAALSVRVPAQRQGVVLGATQSLVALSDVISPVLAGAVIGQALYGVWTGGVVAIALLGAAIAHTRLAPGALHDPPARERSGV